MASSSSSSSSSSALSPNAPPFIPPQSSLFISQQTISTQPATKTLSAKAAPFTKPLNSNSNLENTHPIESPYYPCYDFSSVGFDGFSSSHFDGDDADDLSCMGSVPWNVSSDEKKENGMQSIWPTPSVDLQGTRSKVKITPAKTSGRPKVVISSKKPEPLLSKSTSKTYTACYENTWYNRTAEKTSLNSSLEKLIPSQKNTHDWGMKENDNIAKKMGTDDDSSLTKPLKVLRVKTSKSVNENNDSLDIVMEERNEDDGELDSPCWKGIQAHKQSPFKNDDPKILNHSEKSEQLNFDETKDDSCLVTDINGVFSNVESKDKEQVIDAVQDQCRIYDEKDKMLEKINAEHSSVKAQNDFSPIKSYEALIDKTLLRTRESLLSRIYKDESELNELLHDLLYLACHYPEVNIHNSKKGIANGSDDDYRKKSSIKCILDSVEKDENTIPSRHIISTHDMGMHGAMQPIGHYTTHLQDIADGSCYNVMLEVEQPHIFGVKYDAISKSNVTSSYKPDNSSDIDIVKGIVNEFEATLKKSFCEQEQNVQTLVHNNLWIEAQAKLFSLKYELQLACAEIEILKRNQHPRGRFQELGMLPGLKSLGNPQASNPFIDAGSSSAREFHPRSASENYISFQGLLA